MTVQQLLLIDDDHEFCAQLVAYLTPLGFHLSVANNGMCGIKQWKSHHFDLVLLDLMLPDMHGLELLQRMRQSDLTPVLILSALATDKDRVEGLELGADDYLSKPFNPAELVARIRALKRRAEHAQQQSHNQLLQSKELMLNPHTQKATVCGKALCLTETEFGILYLLMRQARELVSKSHLSEQVLGKKLTTFDRNIDMHISHIRKKIAQVSPTETIKTMRGAGYLFIPPVMKTELPHHAAQQK